MRGAECHYSCQRRAAALCRFPARQFVGLGEPGMAAGRSESARGLAHSTTWRHFGRFMESPLFHSDLLTGHEPRGPRIAAFMRQERSAPDHASSPPRHFDVSTSLPHKCGDPGQVHGKPLVPLGPAHHISGAQRRAQDVVDTGPEDLRIGCPLEGSAGGGPSRRSELIWVVACQWPCGLLEVC
jgi:hypothetical protein